MFALIQKALNQLSTSAAGLLPEFQYLQLQTGQVRSSQTEKFMLLGGTMNNCVSRSSLSVHQSDAIHL